MIICIDHAGRIANRRMLDVELQIEGYHHHTMKKDGNRRNMSPNTC